MSSPDKGRTPVQLRVLAPDDWETWRAIRLEALAEAPYAFSTRLARWESAPEERWRDRLALPGSHNVVAFGDDLAIGMVSGVPGDEPGVAELISMYVAPAARGRGIGGLLVAAVEQWAVGGGLTTLCLDVVADNTAALRLYERHGLVVVGEVSPPGKPLELVMRKRLQPPARNVPPGPR